LSGFAYWGEEDLTGIAIFLFGVHESVAWIDFVRPASRSMTSAAKADSYLRLHGTAEAVP